MSLEPTQFTRESAERIANVVRAAELATPSARPLSFERVDTPQKQRIFRVATFSGAWATGASKTVTFRNVTSTPNTASATNLFFPITNTAAAGSCGIAQEGTAWYLISALQGVVRGNVTAPWAKGATATVTDAGGATYRATNYFAAITASGTRACAIAYAGGEWILIAAECE